MNPLLHALGALGGSGSVEEIYNKVVELQGFSEEVLSQLHDPEKSNDSEVWYRLAWARTYLKKYGLLENSKRGVWALTAKAKGIDQVDPQEVVRTVRAMGSEGRRREAVRNTHAGRSRRGSVEADVARAFDAEALSCWL
jgi:restriction system protein